MKINLLIPLALMLAGCGTTSYKPLAGVTPSNFDMSKAECSMTSRHANDKPTYGSTGQQLGQTISNAIGQAVDFKDCMTMHGWQVAEK